MLIAIATCVVLFIVGRDDLSIKDFIGIVTILGISSIAIFVLRLHPISITVPVVVVDIYMILKIFGSDIAIR